MSPSIQTSEAWFARAQEHIPGGVNSPVRAFGAVGGTPRFFSHGQGPWLFGVEGRRYADLVCSWGPLLLGHAHPAVVEAVTKAAEKGTSFGAPHSGEVLLAEEICERVAPVEHVRLVSSGTEATMSAIRLARAFTVRDTIIKFAGCYHGHSDSLLAAAGSGVATFGAQRDDSVGSREGAAFRSVGDSAPSTPGVTRASTKDTLVLPYNDADALRQAFSDYGSSIACVITEAVPSNMGVVPPADGFNAAIRRLCDEHGALLIMDEVLTGFRVDEAGWYGVEGVAGDLYTFGKVMGGGLPAAAFGGRADIMALLSPAGEVYQAGTLSGNPLATAAGLATLEHATPDVYAQLNQTAKIIANLAGEALTQAGVPHSINTAGNLFSIFFREEQVFDFEGAQRQDTAAFAKFFHTMLDNGVYLPPSAYEAWFVSSAIDDNALDIIATALPKAAHLTASSS